MSDATTGVYTVRLELADRPGELLRALEPIAANGGNLRAILHERGSVTPRGQIPVEVDLRATAEQFDRIVAALEEAGIDVIRAGEERYGQRLTVLLVGHLVETDLSETLAGIQAAAGGSVQGLSLSAPAGTDEPSSARLRLATQADRTDAVLETVRSIAAEKELRVIEPLPEGER